MYHEPEASTFFMSSKMIVHQKNWRTWLLIIKIQNSSRILIWNTNLNSLSYLCKNDLRLEINLIFIILYDFQKFSINMHVETLLEKKYGNENIQIGHKHCSFIIQCSLNSLPLFKNLILSHQWTPLLAQKFVQSFLCFNFYLLKHLTVFRFSC